MCNYEFIIPYYTLFPELSCTNTIWNHSITKGHQKLHLIEIFLFCLAFMLWKSVHSTLKEQNPFLKDAVGERVILESFPCSTMVLFQEKRMVNRENHVLDLVEWVIFHGWGSLQCIIKLFYRTCRWYTYIYGNLRLCHVLEGTDFLWYFYFLYLLDPWQINWTKKI